MRKINVGCAQNLLDGWENIDTQMYPDGNYEGKIFLQVDAREYDYTNADMVLAGHFLEHLTREDGVTWIQRVSQQAPKCVLIIAIPAIDRSCHYCGHEMLQIIASYPKDPYDEKTRGGSHSSLWRTKDLNNELFNAGFKVITEVPEHKLLTGIAKWQYAVEATK